MNKMKNIVAMMVLVLSLSSSVSFAQQAISTLYDEDETVYHWSKKLLHFTVNQNNLLKNQRTLPGLTIEANNVAPLYGVLQVTVQYYESGNVKSRYDPATFGDERTETYIDEAFYQYNGHGMGRLSRTDYPDGNWSTHQYYGQTDWNHIMQWYETAGNVLYEYEFYQEEWLDDDKGMMSGGITGGRVYKFHGQENGVLEYDRIFYAYLFNTPEVLVEYNANISDSFGGATLYYFYGNILQASSLVRIDFDSGIVAEVKNLEDYSTQITKVTYTNGDTNWFLWGDNVYEGHSNVVIEHIAGGAWTAYTFTPNTENPEAILEGWVSIGTVSDPQSLILPELGDWKRWCVDHNIVPEFPPLSSQLVDTNGDGKIDIRHDTNTFINTDYNYTWNYQTSGDMKMVMLYDYNGDGTKEAVYSAVYTNGSDYDVEHIKTWALVSETYYRDDGTYKTFESYFPGTNQARFVSEYLATGTLLSTSEYDSEGVLLVTRGYYASGNLNTEVFSSGEIYTYSDEQYGTLGRGRLYYAKNEYGEKYCYAYLAGRNDTLVECEEDMSVLYGSATSYFFYDESLQGPIFLRVEFDDKNSDGVSDLIVEGPLVGDDGFSPLKAVNDAGTFFWFKWGEDIGGTEYNLAITQTDAQAATGDYTIYSFVGSPDIIDGPDMLFDFGNSALWHEEPLSLLDGTGILGSLNKDMQDWREWAQDVGIDTPRVGESYYESGRLQTETFSDGSSRTYYDEDWTDMGDGVYLGRLYGQYGYYNLTNGRSYDEMTYAYAANTDSELMRYETGMSDAFSAITIYLFYDLGLEGDATAAHIETSDGSIAQGSLDTHGNFTPDIAIMNGQGTIRFLWGTEYGNIAILTSGSGDATAYELLIDPSILEDEGPEILFDLSDTSVWGVIPGGVDTTGIALPEFRGWWQWCADNNIVPEFPPLSSQLVDTNSDGRIDERHDTNDFMDTDYAYIWDYGTPGKMKVAMSYDYDGDGTKEGIYSAVYVNGADYDIANIGTWALSSETYYLNGGMTYTYYTAGMTTDNMDEEFTFAFCRPFAEGAELLTDHREDYFYMDGDTIYMRDAAYWQHYYRGNYGYPGPKLTRIVDIASGGGTLSFDWTRYGQYNYLHIVVDGVDTYLSVPGQNTTSGHANISLSAGSHTISWYTMGSEIHDYTGHATISNLILTSIADSDILVNNGSLVDTSQDPDMVSLFEFKAGLAVSGNTSDVTTVAEPAFKEPSLLNTH